MSTWTANTGRLASIRQTITETSRTRLLLYVVLVGLLLFYLAPLYAGLMTSLKTMDAFNHSVPFAPPLPDGFTTGPWQTAAQTLKQGLINSIILAVPATVLSAFFGSITAYGLTTYDWRGQTPFILLTVAGIFIPYQSVLIPLSRFFSMLNTPELLSPLWAIPGLDPHFAYIVNLIIAHTAYGIQITFLLFRNYYKQFNDEMIEAARMDGASVYAIYRRIILPLSVPMFAVTLIYQFTQIWNDLLFALVILPGGSGAAAPVTVALNSLSGGMVQHFNVQMAGAFIAALPTLVIYVLFGKQFAEGVAAES